MHTKATPTACHCGAGGDRCRWAQLPVKHVSPIATFHGPMRWHLAMAPSAAARDGGTGMACELALLPEAANTLCLCPVLCEGCQDLLKGSAIPWGLIEGEYFPVAGLVQAPGCPNAAALPQGQGSPAGLTHGSGGHSMSSTTSLHKLCEGALLSSAHLPGLANALRDLCSLAFSLASAELWPHPAIRVHGHLGLLQDTSCESLLPSPSVTFYFSPANSDVQSQMEPVQSVGVTAWLTSFSSVPINWR